MSGQMCTDSNGKEYKCGYACSSEVTGQKCAGLCPSNKCGSGKVTQNATNSSDYNIYPGGTQPADWIYCSNGICPSVLGRNDDPECKYFDAGQDTISKGPSIYRWNDSRFKKWFCKGKPSSGQSPTPTPSGKSQCQAAYPCPRSDRQYHYACKTPREGAAQCFNAAQIKGNEDLPGACSKYGGSVDCSATESFTSNINSMVQRPINGFANLSNYDPAQYMTVTPGYWRSQGTYMIDF